MDGEFAAPWRVALVDLDAAGLDALPFALEPWPEVRLAIAPHPYAALWRWAALAGVRRAGEIAALADVVVDAVVIEAASPRRQAVAELAAVLGAAVVPISATASKAGSSGTAVATEPAP